MPLQKRATVFLYGRDLFQCQQYVLDFIGVDIIPGGSKSDHSVVALFQIGKIQLATIRGMHRERHSKHPGLMRVIAVGKQPQAQFNAIWQRENLNLFELKIKAKRHRNKLNIPDCFH